MKFSLVSDLHLDHPQLKTPYEEFEKVVVVAGDTTNGLDCLKFLQKLRNKGFEVVAVDGNHEHYANLSQGRSIKDTTEAFKNLQPSHNLIDGIEFLCINGWYPVYDEPAWIGYMNDGRYADAVGEEVTTQAREDALWLREELLRLQEHGGKAVVVTHTAPCSDTLSRRFEGHFSNEWYWNPLLRPLLDEFNKEILVWCHGHTHSPADKVVSGVRVVTNPRGYPRENPMWRPLTIEV